MGKIYEVTTVNPFTGKEEQQFASGEIELRGEEADEETGTYKVKPAKWEVLDEKVHKAR
jgi:hypothetical protein